MEEGGVSVMIREERQELIATWVREAFGEGQASSVAQRGVRLLEEAVELAQAAGVDEAMAAKLVAYVYGRPAGDVRQELGGVQLCALAMAATLGISADAAEADEVERVLAKPLAHFAERNAVKNAAGFEVA